MFTRESVVDLCVGCCEGEHICQEDSSPLLAVLKGATEKRRRLVFGINIYA